MLLLLVRRISFVDLVPAGEVVIQGAQVGGYRVLPAALHQLMIPGQPLAADTSALRRAHHPGQPQVLIPHLTPYGQSYGAANLLDVALFRCR